MGKVLTPQQAKFAMEIGEESPGAMMNYLVWQTISKKLKDNAELSKAYQKGFQTGFDSCIVFMEEVLKNMREGGDQNA
ncbi:hypothetical protein D1B31_22055 [Neobacillus notoginsengisoli]|uniref:Uncharacterized protein n=1 Tax=Neobacillus notoginsengisoli TaxID=1578198 RepID=A0A417YFM3_9BACI|nr:hypothetical protein [Neobacillus notoginsengisoli]RHW31493.1 hypothetical protein D1B31_22055 [Neobacillus notoginsengisoli]